MITIYADFNARTENDLVRLDTVGSKASLATVNVVPGEWVWLSDGEVRVKACIETMDLARVAWETVEDCEMIKNDEEHLAALKEIEQLWNSEPGTPENERFDKLATLVDEYERKHWPVK